MRGQAIIFLLIFITSFSSVNAQISISSHNITYELREGEVFVKESIFFINPGDSDVHTFDEDILLLRGNIENFLVFGATARIRNDSSPNLIYIEFSKSPLIRSATDNTRHITLEYSTKDFTSQASIDSGKRVYIFSGNILQPLISGTEIKETQINIRPAIGFQFGIIRPETIVKDNTISYFMSLDDRKIYSAFNVEIHYAKFRDLALVNIETIKKRHEEVSSKSEDVNQAILDALVYGANTTKAEDDFSASRALYTESISYLSLTEELIQQGEFYSAYLFSNTSVNLAEAALKSANEAQREANMQLRIGLNEKISQLENLTTRTPPPTTIPPLKEEKPIETPAPTILTVTPTPPEEVDTTVDRGGVQIGTGGVIVLTLILALVILIGSRGKGKKERQAAVKDFRAISDLKKKSYKDFEEKVVDVKKETTIAGEIRRLQKEKEKYALGIENLNKKKLSGEIDEKLFSAEKERFRKHIKELDEKIVALEKELPKKGGLDGKGIPDRPKKG